MDSGFLFTLVGLAVALAVVAGGYAARLLLDAGETDRGTRPDDAETGP